MDIYNRRVGHTCASRTHAVQVAPAPGSNSYPSGIPVEDSTMKKLVRPVLATLFVGVGLMTIGCEGLGDAGTWRIHLVEVAHSHWGNPPATAEWDTTLVIRGREGNLSAYLAGYEQYPLTEQAARERTPSSEGRLVGVLPGNIQAGIWSLEVSGSTLSGYMRWGYGNYGPWRTWTLAGERQ